MDQLAQSLDGDGEEVTVTVTLPRDQVDGVINLLALELDPPVGLIVES